MSENKPVTVKEWREFVARNQGAGGSLSRAHSKMLAKEFDRTVAEVRAEAWDEGSVHGARKCLFAADLEPCPHNPYREETK